MFFFSSLCLFRPCLLCASSAQVLPIFSRIAFSCSLFLPATRCLRQRCPVPLSPFCYPCFFRPGLYILYFLCTGGSGACCGCSAPFFVPILLCRTAPIFDPLRVPLCSAVAVKVPSSSRDLLRTLSVAVCPHCPLSLWLPPAPHGCTALFSPVSVPLAPALASPSSFAPSSHRWVAPFFSAAHAYIDYSSLPTPPCLVPGFVSSSPTPPLDFSPPGSCRFAAFSYPFSFG